MRPNDRAWRPSAAAALLILATAAIPAVAADKPCTKADASNADKAVDKVVSWATLQKAVKDFGHCDTGPTADAFTEALMRVVVSGWPKIAEAEPVFERDGAFRDWTMKRLASDAVSKDDAESVHDLAQNSCPRGLKKLCTDLHDAVDSGKPDHGKPPPKAAPAPAAPAPSAPPTPPAASAPKAPS